MTEKCEHKYIHLETKKAKAVRPSVGFSPARDWKRVDIYFCEKCLEQKIVTQTASWMEELIPDWW